MARRLLGFMTIPLALVFVGGCQRSAAGSDAGSAAALKPGNAAIGMNLAALAYWQQEEPLLDRMRFMDQWWVRGADGKYLPPNSVPVDARGFPRSIPAGSTEISTAIPVDPVSYPTTDRYVVTYRGKANFSFAGARPVGGEPGHWVIEADGSIPFLQVKIGAIDPKDPPRDIHVVRADQVELFAAGKVFNPAFLEKSSQWSTLRMMDWMVINPSAPVDWASRPKPDDISWNAKGMPLEIAIRLANEAHSDLWLNVPTRADDDYVRREAELVRATLDPKRKVYFEYSNEVWNPSFPASRFAKEQGDKEWGANDSRDALVWYGFRSAQISRIVHGVFAGADRARAINVVATQTAWQGREAAIFDGIARAALGSPASLFGAYAITAYFGMELAGARDHQLDTLLGWARTRDAGMTAAFAVLEHGGDGFEADLSLPKLPGVYAYHAAVAAKHGLKLFAYEAGAHLEVSGILPERREEVADFFGRLQRDPRMGRLYARMIDQFGRAGGSLLANYNDVGTSSSNGYFGVLDAIYQQSSPRYDALKAASAKSRAAPAR